MSRRIKRRKPVKRQRLGDITLTIQNCSRGEYHYRFVTRDEQGQRERYFSTKGEAEAAFDAKATEILNSGTRAATSISDGDRRAILEFLDATSTWPEPRPTVPEVLRGFVKEKQALATSGTVADAIRVRMDDAQRRQLSARHRKDLRLRLARFEESFGHRALRGVGAEEISQWLEGLNVGPQSRVNYHRTTSSVFELAARRGLLERNPLDGIGKAKVVQDEAKTFTPGQVAALLAACHDEIRAVVAIMAFTGLRKAEAERLDWKAVDFEHELIAVSAGKAKTASRRLVPMRPNLIEWLLPLAQIAGPVCPTASVYRSRLADACKSAKISHWPVNVLRHSAATYLIADDGDAAQVAAWLGNSPAMLHKHYRALANKKTAAAYWQIVPDADAGKIVALPQSTAAAS